MSKYELEVQHHGTDVEEYSIFSHEMAGGTCKSFMDEMVDKVIADLVKENTKKLKWYHKVFCCSLEEFARKSETDKKIEAMYYNQHKVLFDFIVFHNPHSDDYIPNLFYNYHKYFDQNMF